MNDIDKAREIRQTLESPGWKWIVEGYQNMRKNKEVEQRVHTDLPGRMAAAVGFVDAIDACLSAPQQFVAKNEKPKVAEQVKTVVLGLHGKLVEAFR